MKLIDFIYMIIKKNFRPKKIKFMGFDYVLTNYQNNYCGFDYYCDAAKDLLLNTYDLELLIDDANEIVEIVEE